MGLTAAGTVTDFHRVPTDDSSSSTLFRCKITNIFQPSQENSRFLEKITAFVTIQRIIITDLQQNTD